MNETSQRKGFLFLRIGGKLTGLIAHPKFSGFAVSCPIRLLMLRSRLHAGQALTDDLPPKSYF